MEEKSNVALIFPHEYPSTVRQAHRRQRLRAGNGENKRHGFLEEDQEGPVRRFDKLTAGKAQGRDERGISSSFS
jgi:hypothetical protein